MHHARLPRHQRGAASLLITLGLFLAMLIAAVFVNRNLIFEQRASANQSRSTIAFEAAEAGLAWAIAQLNHNASIGADCLPSTDPGASAFRDRVLRYQAANSSFSAATWADAGGKPRTPRPTCVHDGAAWSCACPASGDASPGRPEGAGSYPAFALGFVAGTQPGSVRVISTGCTSLAGACLPSAGTVADATAQVEVTTALFPALRNAPADALTVMAPSASADAADRFFAAWFGLSKAMWKRQPVVGQVRCADRCADVLAAAIGPGVSSPMIWVEGDLTLTGPRTIGTAERPVLIVVDGTARFDGAVTLHGVVHARELAWTGTGASGAAVHGAALIERAVSGQPTFIHDRAVLARLAGANGTFARVNGSWRDF